MPRGRWRKSEESLAQECFSVLIEKAKPTRSITKSVLMAELRREFVRCDFLKLCIEYDDSEDQKRFKLGLLLIVKAIGATEVAKLTGLNRVNLYRMLTPKGNPSFMSVIKLCSVLGVQLWVVDRDFIMRRSRLTRPKDEKKFGELPNPYRSKPDLSSGNRRILPKRYNRDWDLSRE